MYQSYVEANRAIAKADPAGAKPGEPVDPVDEATGDKPKAKAKSKGSKPKSTAKPKPSAKAKAKAEDPEESEAAE